MADILDDDIEDWDNFTMNVLNFYPIVTITLEIKKHGKEYYEAMLKQLKELDFSFVYTNILDVE